MERRVDDLGRVVIPSHIRHELGFEAGTRLNFELKGDELIITKAAHTCAVCNSENDLKEINGKYICRKCMEKLN